MLPRNPECILVDKARIESRSYYTVHPFDILKGDGLLPGARDSTSVTRTVVDHKNQQWHRLGRVTVVKCGLAGEFMDSTPHWKWTSSGELRLSRPVRRRAGLNYHIGTRIRWRRGEAVVLVSARTQDQRYWTRRAWLLNPRCNWPECRADACRELGKCRCHGPIHASGR